MPTIPRYESRMPTSGGAGLLRQSDRTYLPVVSGVSQIGDAMQRRAESLLQEYDATKALSAFNQLRDQSRAKVSELFQRQGLNAFGAQDDYKTWHQQIADRIAVNDLPVARQRQLYQEMADRARGSALDSLAAHEAREFETAKKDADAGNFEITKQEMADSAFNEPKQADIIAQRFAFLDTMYPGKDLTAKKAEELREYRTSVARYAMIDNPDYAESYIERYKAELGDNYIVLKESLKEKGKQDRVDAAIAVLQDRFGANHELQIATVFDQDNWKQFGIKNNDEAEEVASYFRTMLADRDRTEARAEKYRNDRIRDTEMKILVEQFDPSADRTVDIHQAARRGDISREFYRMVSSGTLDESIVDDWELVGQIWEDIASTRYDAAKEKISSGAANGMLTSATSATLAKKVTDERFGRVMKVLNTRLQPAGLFDRFAPDKQQKQADAMEAMDAMTRAGKSPEDAYQYVMGGYIDSVRRTARNIRTPELLVGGESAKYDVEALENAREQTPIIAQQQGWSLEKYRIEMNAIEELLQIAREVQRQTDGTKEDLEDLRKAVTE